VLFVFLLLEEGMGGSGEFGGKAKKAAITACMRKLITILNTMVKHNTPWHYALEPAVIS
jgi:hypothetical protein